MRYGIFFRRFARERKGDRIISRVKDLRTNVETGNTTAVLDGALESFIEASLKQGV